VGASFDQSTNGSIKGATGCPQKLNRKCNHPAKMGFSGHRSPKTEGFSRYLPDEECWRMTKWASAANRLGRVALGRELVADPSSSTRKGSEDMPSVKKSIATAAMIVLGGLSLSGCATKDYVNKQVAAVSERVGALEAKVAQVDQMAQSANAAAQAAGQSAQNANQRLDQLTARVDSLEQQMAQRQPRN
jgi:outer membrane murein-binding lipoprotein Lpp